MARATPLGGAALGRYPLGVPIGDIPLAGIINTLSGSFVTPADYIADVFAWGQGGTGPSLASSPIYSGGGAAAGYSRLLLPRGSSLSWLASGPLLGAGPGIDGQQGSATTITINGVVRSASGGNAGTNTPAARSTTAPGFQIARYGGGSSERGERGGEAFGEWGGGAGGFRDIFPGLTGGSGVSGSVSSGAQVVPDYGGGGGYMLGGSQYSTWAGAGRVLILLYRI